MSTIITFVILIFSAVVHEVSHGIAAEKLGDSTARDEGRITLNPVPHIDPFGSILLPLLLLWAGSPVVFGAARPVPVNFGNLRNPKSGMALVSLAGPLSNFALAVVLVLPIKFGMVNEISGPILIQAILINLVLGTFNLIPVPPLDGSKIVASFAPVEWIERILSFERYGFILVLLLLYAGVLNRVLVPVVSTFSRLFGLNLI